MNMHRTRFLALVTLAVALTLPAFACRPEAAAPGTATPEVVTVEVTRLVAAANEMDVFSLLDAPTRSVEEQGAAVAQRVHPLDETPLNPYDRTRRDGT